MAPMSDADTPNPTGASPAPDDGVGDGPDASEAGAPAPADASASPPAPPAGVRWTATILAFGALGGSAVLTYQSMGQSVLPGCEPGAGTGCDAVLNSAWSSWFGLPVSAPAIVLYAVMLAATLFIGPGRSVTQRRWAWAVLWIGAVAAIGAAVWFSALQAVVIQAFCRYCTGVHAAGALLAVLVFAAAPRAQPTGPSKLSFAPLTLAGLVLLGALGLGQMGQAQAPVMEASVLEGRLAFRPDEVPTLGAPDAEVWMVYLFDYTCSHCRRMHPHLSDARQRYGDQLGIVLLPTPLGAECNPMVSSTPEPAEHACELATLALAVWHADPAQFSAFNAWMYQDESPPTPDEARARAIELVGEPALDEALAGGWPASHIEDSTTIYRHIVELTGRGAVPTLVVGSAIFGATPDAETLFEGLEEHTPLTPRPEAHP